MTRFERSADTLPVPAGRDGMRQILTRCGITFTDAQLDRLWTYHQLLRRYNPELNLTRIHNFANMVMKLYVDSILPGRMAELPSPLMDLGTGPGMPGIPLKIAHPHLHLLLAESRGKRVEFLKTVCRELGFDDVEIIGRGIEADFAVPVRGVVTRAVEAMAATLSRVRGCVEKGGRVLFMKGPNCDAEIAEALRTHEGSFILEADTRYVLPGTPHRRRLVVFQRVDEPVSRSNESPGSPRRTVKRIESAQNPVFKELKRLLYGRGVKKAGKTLVAGSKLTADVAARHRDRVEGWISRGDEPPPPADLEERVSWIALAPSLFDELDVFGTRCPMLLAGVPDMPAWEPASGLQKGCSLLIPFQDPENVGAVVRSAVAFGVERIVLLEESAHPFHPKALRASGGAAFQARFLRGPSLSQLPRTLPILPLSQDGMPLEGVDFPEAFGLLPGIEGAGLPAAWRFRAIAVPISPEVESLNAATATAIVLYEWSRRRRIEDAS
ncbi:16S rRNA (guanine(527)-N(7))-methyltransferase RsmG [Desulfoglaeba alkanexedens]|jgi:16S rRNA (guanine527-N7)-methyltransferase|uniref:Ribosomal RNA small subunit methyltransferase G n=1 Tax=Desulfoglaeba alkanexedens ALDC TaxID=980445 RepID=A0A4P8L537_9BACT|nr:16S rRNA (guanine(527)-N(7))-methyltransferase RsmG [Desulfoglaeba alkanexedens]QCQ22843.1 16S rRNA (guanine(527)-N(7))-methyltransferase RsmG [Desulfoglaeba alkanexedens ALDC]